MNFEKKLNIRIYVGIIIALIGAGMMILGYLNAYEMSSSFGLCFLVIGIARVLKTLRIKKNPEIFEKVKTAEQDERNIKLWTEARSLAVSIYVIFSGLAIVALYFFGMEEYGKIVSYNIFGFILIYWICYFITSKKY